MYGSEYPVVKELGKGATNAGKKAMVREWLRDEKISVSLPNIFELGIRKSLPHHLGESYSHFLIVDKPEYDLVLGSSWLIGCGSDIDYYAYQIDRNALWEKRGKFCWREDSIEIMPQSASIGDDTSNSDPPLPIFTVIFEKRQKNIIPQ
ncbi:2_t:CDS:2 [Diversispora eburnea]|uniref:2_t:CDS:1 n=1 Tax=Diversispora eburnea TaxID=1213867 RepID=A0A9N9C9N0_9GLOM|nr:2_t:CDS:2 [Diversispora eburnea]